ncbi:MAG: 30S ribosomal protein S20 [Thermoguttaceae bacterium]
MPNTTSAKKRLKQNKVLRERNRSLRTTVRNRCKKVVKFAGANNLQEAETAFADAVKTLDRMGAKKILHKNAAARKKSRLSAMLKKLKANTSV